MYETDWTAGAWWLAATMVLIAAAYVVSAPLVAGTLLSYTDRLPRGVLPTLWVVAGIAFIIATFALFSMPGTMMRHVAEQTNVWWIATSCLVLATALGIRGVLITDSRRWTVWVPALLLLIGTITGLAMDALHRAAAAIPMNVGTFAVILITGVLMVLLLTALNNRA